VEPPPFLGEFLACLPAGVEHDEIAGAIAAANLRLEGQGVRLAVEGAGAVAVAVSPADTPAGSALPWDALDAHRGGISLRSPLEAGNRSGVKPGTGSRWLTMLASTHAATSSGRMRRREQRRNALSSPRSIARYTALRLNPQ